MRRMCLAVPCKVVAVGEEKAQVLYEGGPRWVQAIGFPDLAVGEYVTVHAGVILNRMPAEAAEEILSLYAELAELMEVESD